MSLQRARRDNRLRLVALLCLYALAAYGLDGPAAAVLSIPTDCGILLSGGEGHLRQWMTGTFIAHLALGFFSRHLLLWRFEPECSVFRSGRTRPGYGLADGTTVAVLMALTVLVPNAMIYFSAAPLIPLASAFGLTWLLRRRAPGRIEWQHFAYGFEIALVMWVGALHAGGLALRCTGQ
tara:strand:- start:829 stop:1365 length:537 start_codon:yes stop_codon:yes gene_type:complete